MGIHHRDEVITYIYIYAAVCIANVNNTLTKEAPIGVEGRPLAQVVCMKPSAVIITSLSWVQLATRAE